jgi:tetratricopeptide (TPR) repeat protein
VSEPLFDQYKAALRRGHMAALSGDFDEALAAYRNAARVAPDRTLPLASQGTLLHRLDRWPEAAEVFDAALRLAADDEATLRARATAREERGMHSGAAADFERLAFVLDVAGRAREAAEAARRANELDPGAARATLAERLARSASPRRAGSAEPESAPQAVGTEAVPGRPQPEPDAVEADDTPLTPVINRVVPRTDAEVARAAQDVDPSSTWPALDMPSPTSELVGPPPDTEQLMAEAAALFDVGDVTGAGERMLTAVAVHRAAGRLDAALDACFQLLALSPGDPHVHLAIATLQLDRGWTPLAREKIELLLRLTSLTGDTQAEADTLGLASERLRDEPVGSAIGR